MNSCKSEDYLHNNIGLTFHTYRALKVPSCRGTRPQTKKEAISRFHSGVRILLQREERYFLDDVSWKLNDLFNCFNFKNGDKETRGATGLTAKKNKKAFSSKKRDSKAESPQEEKKLEKSRKTFSSEEQDSKIETPQQENMHEQSEKTLSSEKRDSTAETPQEESVPEQSGKILTSKKQDSKAETPQQESMPKKSGKTLSSKKRHSKAKTPQQENLPEKSGKTFSSQKQDSKAETPQEENMPEQSGKSFYSGKRDSKAETPQKESMPQKSGDHNYSCTDHKLETEDTIGSQLEEHNDLIKFFESPFKDEPKPTSHLEFKKGKDLLWHFFTPPASDDDSSSEKEYDSNQETDKQEDPALQKMMDLYKTLKKCYD